MSASISSRLKLELAWRRLKLDRDKGRGFVTYPYLIEWLEADLGGWLDTIAKELDSKEGYVPRGCVTCYAPKDGWLVRPGAVLDLKDEVVYTAILGAFHEQIWTEIGWSQGSTDISCQLQQSPATRAWVHSGVRQWRKFEEKSLTALESDVSDVLFTDVSGFYENIDLVQLASDLRQVGVDPVLLSLLSKCLNHWAHPRAKGIPQGYSSSDILAKLYLNSVDRRLSNSGLNHIRYNDDFRIFCPSATAARKALLELNILLYNRGLNLHPAKTEIIGSQAARRRIEGVTPKIQSVRSRLRQELMAISADAGPYATLADIRRAVGNSPNAPTPEVLEQTFQDHFVPSLPDDSFNKTLFHFLLSRLGAAKSRIAVDYSLAMLALRPEETEHVLRYLEAIDPTEQDIEHIISFLSSEDAVYEYQWFQLIVWFFRRGDFPDELVAFCRRWAFDQNKKLWLRAYSLAILGEAGDISDLEAIRDRYSELETEIGRAQSVAALVKMERGQRNAFYGRVMGGSDLVVRAVTWAKQRG